MATQKCEKCGKEISREIWLGNKHHCVECFHVINDYTGSIETLSSISFTHVQALQKWDSDLGITIVELPALSLPKNFIGKKLRMTVEIVE